MLPLPNIKCPATTVRIHSNLSCPISIIKARQKTLARTKMFLYRCLLDYVVSHICSFSILYNFVAISLYLCTCSSCPNSLFTFISYILRALSSKFLADLMPLSVFLAFDLSIPIMVAHNENYSLGFKTNKYCMCEKYL